jgi:type II secretory ATPase GspE/PulE/Tfp pilus assembly ATPase PilB-like protein
MKLLSKLKLNITSKPQDGRFTILLTEDKIDVRVSTIPTAYGESVVMRLLKSSVTGLQFKDLGIIGLAKTRMDEQVARPNGMIITTGPTGSGKTTTLYAILNKLNVEGTKIITLEDPIEYRLTGINQSQIDHSKNYSFADGLRSILRQDPDVVMVGEMRDLETADVAINAALTGHLVLSTIHTNSASGAIPRFIAMGVKGFLLAPALNAIMGQRLVRRICKECKEETKTEEKDLERAKKLLSEIPEDHEDRPDMTNMKFFKGKGCDKCNGMGYKGRVGIFEIMVMSPEIEKIILSGKVSEFQMQDLAIKSGMITMVQDGLIKTLQGLTTLEEVFRVSE